MRLVDIARSRVLAQSVTITDGRFAIPISSNLPSPVFLLARKNGCGTASRRVDTHGDTFSQLVLGGPADLSGFVLGEDGRPVEGVLLQAVADDVLDAGSPSNAYGSQRRATLLEEGTGLNLAYAYTDRSGHFVMNGLRRGHPYQLCWSSSVLAQTWGPYVPGDRPIYLTLQVLRVRLRVVDREGNPIAGALVTFQELGNARPLLSMQTKGDGMAVCNLREAMGLRVLVSLGNRKVIRTFEPETVRSQGKPSVVVLE